MNEIRQKFEAWLITEALDDGEIEWDAWRAAYEAGEIAMKEKAAQLLEEGGTVTWSSELFAIARAIRALPLSGAEESKKDKA